MRAKAILLSLVPGLGHIYLGRTVQGVTLFALIAIAVNGLFLSAVWQGDETAWRIRIVAGAAASGIWAFAMASTLKLTLLTDREALKRQRDGCFVRGLTHYLRNELGEAERAFLEALTCDIDRNDADVLFHLGVMARRRGDDKRARRMFRRSLACTVEEKWRLEIERELLGRRVRADDAGVLGPCSITPQPRCPQVAQGAANGSQTPALAASPAATTSASGRLRPS